MESIVYNTKRSEVKTETPTRLLRATVLPQSLNLLSQRRLPVKDQGQLGTCVSNCGANVYTYSSLDAADIKNVIIPSRLFLYYFARVLDGANTPTEDSGTTVEAVLKVFSQYGTPSELSWPYDVSKYNVKPPPSVIAEAKTKAGTFKYRSISQSEYDIKNALFTSMRPIMFGLNVYSSFESVSSISSGNIPMPDPNSEDLLGGHCLTIIGFDDTTSQFLCLNSWGEYVAKEGLFRLPYDYVTSNTLAFDFFQETSL